MTQEEARAAILSALADDVLTRDELDSRLVAAGAADAVAEVVPMARAGLIAVRSNPDCRRGWLWNPERVPDDVAYNRNDC